jgi:plasmid stabilization system protein ParE
MACKIEWSEIAFEDLERIYNYYTTGNDFSRAENFRNRVLKLVDLIAIFPKIGMVDPEDSSHRRFRLDGYHYIAYSIGTETLMIEAIIPFRMNRGRFSEDK